MLSFDFLEKGLRIVSPPYFVYGFLRKMFPNFMPKFHCLITFTSLLLALPLHWSIWVLQLFVSKVVTSQISKLTLSFY